MILKIKKLLLVATILTLFIVLSPGFSFAQSPTSTPTPTQSPGSSNLTQLQKEISDLQTKLSETQKQKNTLASQISVMNSQIKLTELRISATKQEIEDLIKDIETTDKKISKLEINLDSLSKILLNRVVTTYEVGTTQPFYLLLSSSNVGDFLTRLNYLKVAQTHDRKLIFETQQAKNDYTNQKQILEDKKIKVESLRKQLESYTAQINKEKKDKESLLATTKNSEAEYQRKLADALRELSQIQSAARFLITTEPKDVKRGQEIGLMGSTGFSTGPHLHFGVYNVSSLTDYNYYSSYEDPANVLESRSVKWDTGCANDPAGSIPTGRGSFQWPMSTGNLYISQGYGNTCWSWMYQGKPHPAFDLVNNDDIVVRAVADGKAYICRNCTGDGGNGVFIIHSGGKMTLYWHLQ